MCIWYFVILSVIIGAVARDGDTIQPNNQTTSKSEMLKRVDHLSVTLTDKIKVFNDRVNEINSDISSILLVLNKSQGSYLDELMQKENLNCQYISSCVTQSLSEMHNETNKMFYTTYKLLEKFENKLQSFSTEAIQRMINLEKRLERLQEDRLADRVDETKRDIGKVLLVQNQTNEMCKSANKTLVQILEQMNSFSTSATQRLIDQGHKLERLPEIKRDINSLLLVQNENKEMSKSTNKYLVKVSDQLHSFSTTTTQRLISLEHKLERLPEIKHGISNILLVQQETNGMFISTNKSLEKMNQQSQIFATATKQRMINLEHKLERLPEDMGVYFMKPDPSKNLTFEVSRDWTNNHGFGNDWIVFQRRFNGSVNFYRNWTEYKEGFGDLRGEHWLGLEKLHAIVKTRQHELLIVLEDFDGVIAYAHYDNFKIGDESEKYIIKSVAKYTGTAGDSFAHHKGHAFSTYDQDNDKADNCARYFHGAWWFNKCYSSHLNGAYLKGKIDHDGGIAWNDWRGKAYSLKSTKMMVRPVA